MRVHENWKARKLNRQVQQNERFRKLKNGKDEAGSPN